MIAQNEYQRLEAELLLDLTGGHLLPGLPLNYEDYLAAAVQQATGLGRSEWLAMKPGEREPYLVMTLASRRAARCPTVQQTEANAEDQDAWLPLAAVARGLGWFVCRGKKERPDSARVSRLGLDDNGRKKRERRISRRSVKEYILSQGLDWNEAAATSPKGSKVKL